MKLFQAISAVLLLTLLLSSGCSSSTTSDITQAGEDTVQSQVEQESSAASLILQEESEIRNGTHEDTLATPSDFPESYDYGSGRYTDWDYGGTNRRLPEPEGNETVFNTVPDLTKIQALYLWEEGNFPAQTEVTRDNFDPVGFRPYLTAIPVREGIEVKGAVVLLAGGAFQVRANYTDTLPTAAHLRELGYQTFIVDYRLRPYTQEEGALDVARAVRFIRKNADIYGIDPNDIAVMGYSAGGIQAGEFFLHYDEDVLPTTLDPDYVPDELDAVPAHASACGMIYSFYGRLSVASMDEESLRAGNLPPTFYCYGTEDPFYNQFEAQYDLMQNVGISTRRIVLQDWPHGFGGDGGWVEDYAQWLEQVFSLN
ncbi:MAG TPA: alpha/beta hydrolase [Candidatus Gallacutalibacter stercoravium]|nr:alpha/beta hydrolase [Candidatus Gallacutalibacter stercoravium]